ncbi:MAG TPA: MFS transporter, partial [Woeseiaceae bacterium]|nr:MFS transporter [Woeseiaceae bacterium]
MPPRLCENAALWRSSYRDRDGVPLRNLCILFFCQLVSATGSIVIVTLGGIIGSMLAGNPAFATLPVSLMVVSVAATAIPATVLMRRIGRKAGFVLGSLSAAAAVLLATIALERQSFVLFAISAGLFGINMAFTQQYRYAAAESVDGRHTARAISLVLVGAIGGALLGPELVTRGQHWSGDVQYAGTLIAVAILFVLQSLSLLFLSPLRGETGTQNVEPNRSLKEIVRQPVYRVAVLSAAVAYGAMTLLMTATPISMHVNDGFAIEDTANVIRSHVLGMYLPSLFAGFLMDRFGTVKIMMAGALALTGACLVGLHGHSYMHYWYALIMLGVGWNFLYVGGTTMLTLTYSVGERFRAQAINEFTVFGTSASASLLAGVVIHYFGWNLLVTLPLL